MSRLKEAAKKFIALIVVKLFKLFPIKKNKIFFLSYYGSQYGCNPKYITEYILSNYPKNRFDLVWAFNDVNSKESISGVRKVKTMSWAYFYELCTSKVIITNFRTTDLFIKRKNQYYIQTWHSSLRLKQIEKDARDQLTENYIQMAQKDSLKCNLLLSGCKFSTDIFRRAFWYDGPIFEHGTPRNDLLFHEDSLTRVKILEKLKIPRSAKIILYAPTFRKNQSLEIYNLDFTNILDKLSRRFGGDWFFLRKLHPHLISQTGELAPNSNVLDVTSYDDIQELLAVSDVVISDYSSLIFDFALTKRPCFLYVPDIEDYLMNDRQLYFDLRQLPFVSATSNEQLLAEIDNFDSENYMNRLSGFLTRVGSYEEGRACESLLRHIEQVCTS